MARKRGAGGTKSVAPGAPQVSRGGVPQSPEVTLEARLRMAACCAFFAAEKYRDAEPGRIRSADIERAREQIDNLIKQCSTAHGSEGT